MFDAVTPLIFIFIGAVIGAAFIIKFLFRCSFGVAFGSLLMVGGAMVILWGVNLSADTHGRDNGMANLVFGIMWIFGGGVIALGFLVRLLSKRSEKQAMMQKQNPPLSEKE